MQDDEGTPVKAPWSRPVIVRLDTNDETGSGSFASDFEGSRMVTWLPTLATYFYYPFFS